MPLAEYEGTENEFNCGMCHRPIDFEIIRTEEED